jgi:hypothetical protein
LRPSSFKRWRSLVPGHESNNSRGFSANVHTHNVGTGDLQPLWKLQFSGQLEEAGEQGLFLHGPRKSFGISTYGETDE